MLNNVFPCAVLAQAAEGAESSSLLDYVRAGGLIGYVLIVLSLAAVTLMIMHFIQVRRERLMPPEIAAELRRAAGADPLDRISAFCSRPENDCFLTRVVGSAMERCMNSPFGALEIRTALQEAGQPEVDKLYRSTDGIGLIAAIGPMLGLLGTVIGMIGAFATIGKVDGARRSEELAGYMSLALVTTALGLIVAIPCTAAYTLFRRRIERHVDEASRFTEHFAARIEARSAPGTKG